jgi:hypothetical protein
LHEKKNVFSSSTRNIAFGRRTNESVRCGVLSVFFFAFRNMPWYWPFSKDTVSSETYSIDNPTLIEGISDDTILLVIFTLSLIGLWIYYSR